MIKVTNSGAEHTVEIFGEIGQSFWGDGWTFERFKNELKGITAPILNVKIKSNGGDIFEAFAIHDELKTIPARVVIDIVGSSASAATVIAAAGDEVRISENSMYLVHNAQTFVAGNKETLSDVYDNLEKIDNQIVNIYVKRTGKDRTILAELMKSERWMTAEEAKDWGFVDTINKNAKIVNKMEKFKNLTEEEQMEFDALKAENEALKAELEEMKAAKAAMEEEEIEKEVMAAIEGGKFKADAKDTLLFIAKINREKFNAIVESVETPKAVVAEPITNKLNVEAKASDTINTKEQFDAAWKANKFVNNTALFQKEYSRFYNN